MTARAVAVRHDVPLPKVAKAMVRRRFRSLPVLGADDRVVGMVSRGDLLRAETPGLHPVDGQGPRPGERGSGILRRTSGRVGRPE